MANCPKCPNRSLSPTLLAPGLSAKGCQSCRGTLVDLLAYRAWAEQSGIDAAEVSSASSIKIEDTSQAIACPHCGSVMIKYRVSASAKNRLDFCARCDKAWLDGGEWTQLHDLGIRENLGSVFTEPWQRRVHSDLAEQSKEAMLRQKLGEEFGRLAELRAWLQNHPDREYILAWLASRGAA